MSLRVRSLNERNGIGFGCLESGLADCVASGLRVDAVVAE